MAACGPVPTTSDAAMPRDDAAPSLGSDAGLALDAVVLGGEDALVVPGRDAFVAAEDAPLASSDVGPSIADAGPSFLDARPEPTDAGPGMSDAGPPPPPLGWTDLPLASDARAVYVSSVTGNDADGHGLSPMDPVRTLARGFALLRGGRGDHLLLHRGESWRESFPQWTKSGASERYPMVIGAYGEGARPRIRSAGRSAWTATAAGVLDYVAIVGLHFDASERGEHDNPYGVFRTMEGTWFLVEDCLFEQYRVNVSLNNDPERDPPIRDVVVRRSVIVDAHARAEGRTCRGTTTCTAAECGVYSATCEHNNCEILRDQIEGQCIPHSQGLYAANVVGLVVEENVFDGNGWRAGVEGGRATNYNHGMYVQADARDVTVTGNVFANASSHGAQVRPGGIVEDNLFAGNAIGLSFGYVLGAHDPTDGGVTGVVRGNVVRRGDDIRDAEDFYRGIGMQLGNLESAIVSDNVISHYASAREYGTAFQISHTNGRGVGELTFERNVVFDWCRPLWLEGAPRAGSILRIRDNVLESRDSLAPAVDTPTIDLSAAMPLPTFADLHVWSARAADGWFRIGGVYRSREQFLTTTGAARVTAGRSTFVDSGRDLASFHASSPSPRGSSWLAGARLQSRADWRDDYTGRAITAYLRAGFARR